MDVVIPKVRVERRYCVKVLLFGRFKLQSRDIRLSRNFNGSFTLKSTNFRMRGVSSSKRLLILAVLFPFDPSQFFSKVSKLGHGFDKKLFIEH